MNATITSLRDALFEIAPFAVWVPVIVGLLMIGKAPVYIRLLVAHLVFTGIVQAIAFYLWKRSENNLPLLHLYTVEELVMLTLFYSYVLSAAIPRRIFLTVIGLFVLLAVLNALFIQPLKTHNTYMRSLESLVIIIWTIIYFYRRLADEYDEEPEINPGKNAILTEADLRNNKHRATAILWMNSGFLVYFSASLLLFTLGNFMAGKAFREISKNLWAIHAFVSICLYIVIAIGLWIHRRTET